MRQVFPPSRWAPRTPNHDGNPAKKPLENPRTLKRRRAVLQNKATHAIGRCRNKRKRQASPQKPTRHPANSLEHASQTGNQPTNQPTHPKPQQHSKPLTVPPPSPGTPSLRHPGTHGWLRKQVSAESEEEEETQRYTKFPWRVFQ